MVEDLLHQRQDLPDSLRKMSGRAGDMRTIFREGLKHTGRFVKKRLFGGSKNIYASMMPENGIFFTEQPPRKSSRNRLKSLCLNYALLIMDYISGA
jgi:hypothetical protein